MFATHMDAETRYASYRSEVFRYVQASLTYADAHRIQLTDITIPALRQVNLWDDTQRQVSFDWRAYLQQYRKVCPKRFELAIWYNGRLESLSLGRPSYKGTRLRLELIERVPSNSYLRGRVFPITEIALIAYANLLGAVEVRIMEPVNENVRAYYVSRGYSYVPSTGAANFPDYCVRKL